jgi:hypothetical protein
VGYILSNLDRDPSFSAVLDSIDFSQLRSRQISSFLQSANFLSSFVGLSNFRSVIDCLVDLLFSFGLAEDKFNVMPTLWRPLSSRWICSLAHDGMANQTHEICLFVYETLEAI